MDSPFVTFLLYCYVRNVAVISGFPGLPIYDRFCESKLTFKSMKAKFCSYVTPLGNFAGSDATQLQPRKGIITRRSIYVIHVLENLTDLSRTDQFPVYLSMAYKTTVHVFRFQYNTTI